MQIKKLETMISRTGRQMQRYNQGCRQVVGCIPFRFRQVKESSMISGSLIDEIEVLLISSQKGPHKLMFPKGGWELDEELAEAACRETFEEAGVVGTLMNELGIWSFKSNSQGVFHEGRMIPLFVEEVRDVWPEENVRHRIWMSIDEARERCAHIWMKEALDVWSGQLLSLSLRLNRNGTITPCLRDFLCPKLILSVAAQSGAHTWMNEASNVWIDQFVSHNKEGSEPTFLGDVEYCLCS